MPPVLLDNDDTLLRWVTKYRHLYFWTLWKSIKTVFYSHRTVLRGPGPLRNSPEGSTGSQYVDSCRTLSISIFSTCHLHFIILMGEKTFYYCNNTMWPSCMLWGFGIFIGEDF